MGYRTRFEISIQDGVKEFDEYINEIEQLSGYQYNFLKDGAKWYQCEHDMRIISANNPNVLFTVKGEGEESGDIWAAYFRNGLCQTENAKIVVEPFNELKLR